VVQELTRNSGPWGSPPALQRCPKTPKALASWPELCQTTTKFPFEAEATAGERWTLVV